MKMQKFEGPTSRDVLRQVRTQLGPDAVIVQSRTTATGIEITAMAGTDMESMLGQSPVRAPAPEREPVQPGAPGRESAAAVSDAAQAPAQLRAPPAETEALMSELKAMRSAVESQLSQLAWNDTARRSPLRAKLTRDLLAAGFSALTARNIGTAMPLESTPAQAGPWLEAVLRENLRVVAAGEDVVTRGGTYAVIGPTGVGKTTTVAKLAARCVVKHGAASLALITTDDYRIGAHDQLRTYAKILGVSMHSVRSADELGRALDGMADRHMVLIDTTGMGQRDQRMGAQAMLLAHERIARLFVASAAAQAETLEEALIAYRGSAPLAGAIVTKVDEAARTGQALDLLIRHRLPLHFVANGQRVPEDLHLANASYLVHSALRAAIAGVQPSSPFALDAAELALVAGARPAMSRLHAAKAPGWASHA